MSSLLIGVIETTELESAIGWQSLAEPSGPWDSAPTETMIAEIDQLEADLAAEWRSFSERLGN